MSDILHFVKARKVYRHPLLIAAPCLNCSHYRFYYRSAYRRALMRIGIVFGCGFALLVIVYLIDVVFLPGLSGLK
jgi:hypothetical protein